MNRSYAILFFLLYSVFLNGQVKYENADKKKLSEILTLLEQKNNVSFSYNNKAVDKQSITYQGGQYSLNQLLDIVFKQTPLSYEFIDTSHITISNLSVAGRKLCGYIYDSKSKTPLSGATISDVNFKQGEITDKNGYFEFILKDEFEILTCSYLGYEEMKIKISKDAFSTCQKYELQSKEFLFPEITLTEYLDGGISVTKDANQIVLNPNEMSMLPGNVEKDIMSSLQFLPGITSPTESLDRLHIRGGTPDQNLILWDDIPMYNSSHLFGAINGFNPFMIDQVNVYRNGVSSRFGGRVSGVIDIKSKSQIPDKISISGGFNLTQQHTEFIFPLFKKSAIFLSTRLSLTEAWHSPTFKSYADKIFQTSQISTADFKDVNNTVKFNDITFKYIYTTQTNEIELSILGGWNNLEYNTPIPQFKAFSIDILDLKHSGSKISWKRDWSSRFNSEFILSTTQFTNTYSRPIMSIEDPTNTPVKEDFQNDLVEENVRLGFNWQFEENKSVRFGYQYTQDDIDLSWSRKNFENMTSNSDVFENKLHALYSDFSMDIPEILHLDIGLRYHYSPLLKNEYFEPRIGVTTNITDVLKLKLSTSKNFQFVSQLVILDTNQLGLANQIWVVADNSDIPVIEANQWTGGLIYIKDKWTIEGDAYVKELAGITSLSDSFDPTINIPYSRGTARISGIDLLIKKRFKYYKSWLSYSFSKANYEFLTLNSQSFPATYDQRHILQFVNLYKRNKWEFSAGLTFKSGLPFTNALGIQNNKIEYAPLNSSRLGNYIKLDASVVYYTKQEAKSKSYIALSFQNIGDRINTLSRRYRIDRIDRSDDGNLATFETIGLGFTPNLAIFYTF